MRLHHSIARRLSMLVATGALMVLAACSTIDRGTPPSLERHASWVVLPFANHTETPMAGNRAGRGGGLTARSRTAPFRPA